MTRLAVNNEDTCSSRISFLWMSAKPNPIFPNRVTNPEKIMAIPMIPKSLGSRSRASTMLPAKVVNKMMIRPKRVHAVPFLTALPRGLAFSSNSKSNGYYPSQAERKDNVSSTLRTSSLNSVLRRTAGENPLSRPDCDHPCDSRIGNGGHQTLL